MQKIGLTLLFTLITFTARAQLTIGTVPVAITPTAGASSSLGNSGITISNGTNININGNITFIKLNGVLPAEIGYVSGVTSPIQTQLNSKLNASALGIGLTNVGGIISNNLTAGNGISFSADTFGNNTISVAPVTIDSFGNTMVPGTLNVVGDSTFNTISGATVSGLLPLAAYLKGTNVIVDFKAPFTTIDTTNAPAIRFSFINIPTSTNIAPSCIIQIVSKVGAVWTNVVDTYVPDGAQGTLLSQTNYLYASWQRTSLHISQDPVVGVIRPAQLVANTDDWNPTGFDTADVIEFSTDISRNITGFKGMTDGRPRIFHNNGTQNAVFKTLTGSVATNQLKLNADITLAASQALTFRYDLTAQVWFAVAALGGSGAGTVGTVINTGTSIVSNVPRYIDTTGTNIAPSTATISSSGNMSVSGSIAASTSLSAGATSFINFTGRGALKSSADGFFQLFNNAGNNFTELDFGGTGSGNPALRVSGTTLQHRLADNSADGPMSASSGTFSTAINGSYATASTLAGFDSSKNIVSAAYGLGITNNAGTVSNNITAGTGITLTAGAGGNITIASTASSGGIAGTIINTGASVVSNIPRYTDTTGTNVAPSSATITSGGNISVANLLGSGTVQFSGLVGGTGKYAAIDASGNITPASPTLFRAYSGFFAATNSVTETNLFSFTLPANTLGTNKSIQIIMFGKYLNNSGSNRNVQYKVYYGGTKVLDGSVNGIGTSASFRDTEIRIQMSASQNSTQAQAYSLNVVTGGNGAGTTGYGSLNVAAPIGTQGATSAIDSTIDQTVLVAVVLSNAETTSYLNIENSSAKE